MGNRKLLILGGYGRAGSAISRLLLREADVALAIAGRHKEKAEELADQLNEEFPGSRISALYADAAKPESLKIAFGGADMVLDCATASQHLKQIAQSALDAGADFLDIHFQQDTLSVLRELAPVVEKAGRFFITQAGCFPGLSSVMVRRAWPYFRPYKASVKSRYRKAVVGVAMNLRDENPDAVREIIGALDDYKAEIFKEGRWQSAGYKDVVKLDFGSMFGVRSCYPIQLAEMRTLPETFGMEHVGVYVAGFNWFVDNVVFPSAMVAGKIKKNFGRDCLAKMLSWGMNTFSGSETGLVFVVEAEGEKDGRCIQLRILAEHNDAYFFNAVPVVASLLQYFDGAIVKPGLWMMGHIVDPIRLMKDIERMDIIIECEVAYGDSRFRRSCGRLSTGRY